MQSNDIHAALKQNLGAQGNYDDAAAKKFANGLGDAMAAAAPAASQPTPKQQACYGQCEAARDAAFAAAWAKGWPGALIAVAAAVIAFNACRATCDQNP